MCLAGISSLRPSGILKSDRAVSLEVEQTLRRSSVPVGRLVFGLRSGVSFFPVADPARATCGYCGTAYTPGAIVQCPSCGATRAQGATGHLGKR